MTRFQIPILGTDGTLGGPGGSPGRTFVGVSIADIHAQAAALPPGTQYFYSIVANGTLVDLGGGTS